MLQGQNSVPATELFRKSGDVTRGKLSLHVAATCPLGKVHFSWGGGRAGASERRVISENEHQKGRAIPHVSYSREGHTSFPESFNENFCDVAFHFSYRLSFSFTYFDLIWCFVGGTRLHFYMYIMPWHIVFSEDSCPFPSFSVKY